jgi:PAS domain S-box-containing protein
VADPDQELDAPAALFEESAEDLYENAPCGYLSALPGGRIIKANQTFLSWTGYRREDLVNVRRFQDLLTPGGRIYHETHYAPLLQIQGSVREIAVEVICADGKRLPVLINSTIKRDAAGRALLVRTTVFNATDRKQYERELMLARKKAEDASKAKADFISMVSHEIRTPLNAIQGVAHLLKATELSPQQQKLVRILDSSTENLLRLVNDILDFSKIESGNVTVEERVFDLRELISGAVQNLSLKAEEKGIALAVSLDESLPASLLGDPIKIGQVLTNLLGNAVKFTHQGAVTLTVQAREASPEAVSIDFRVADTGIGIPPDRLPHIFDDFTQASSDIGAKYGGTGLGLAISRRLVELHGSKLAVESELGRGTAFSFGVRCKIPPVRAESNAERESAGEPADRILAGLRALVVDDNEVNGLVLGAYLDFWGVRFDVVTDGRDAVERVGTHDYDLVLMDLRMPHLDGYSATRAIRALPDAKLAALPIIAVSASTRMGHQAEIEAAGFNDFVGKPIDPDILFAKIARLTSRGDPLP